MHIGKKTLEVMGEAPWYNDWLLKRVRKYLKGDILEIGHGIGNFTDALSDFGRVTAIDFDEVYQKQQQKKKGVTIGYGDIERGKYFFGRKKFDCVICFNVLEHIKEDRKALSNMDKLLKKKGFIVLLVPAHKLLYSEFDKEIGHHRRYSKTIIKNISSDMQSKLLELEYLNWWAAIGWFVFVRLTKKRHLPSSKVKIFDNYAKYLLFIEKYISSPFGLSLLAVYQK